MSRISRSARSVPELTWWFGLVVSTGVVLVGGLTVADVHVPPQSPFDATRSGHAEQWIFVNEVATVVPEGSSVTVHASNPDIEMSLYMMAVGLAPRATVIPRSYYGRFVAESNSARFVATYDPGAKDVADSRSAIAVAGGIVADLGRRPQ